MIYQLIYSSEATTPMTADDLDQILEHSRLSNAAAGITGALIYAEGSFLQILEGDRVRVENLLEKIRQDLRHRMLTVLRRCEIPRALFGNWKMAYVSATSQQVANWAGFSVANSLSDSPNRIDDERRRTEQFAKDILSLLERGRPDAHRRWCTDGERGR